jgi:hypothetical protein
MRKECHPGMPGCVLRGKVVFISEVEHKPSKRPAMASKKPSAKRPVRKQAERRIQVARDPGNKGRG